MTEMGQVYRQGAIGALLDEYERAISDLKKSIETISSHELIALIAPLSKDENCRSFQAILSHVVSSGFGYATSICNLKDPQKQRPGKIVHTQIKAYLHDLDAMFAFTAEVLAEFKDTELEQTESSLKIKTGWGQEYDIEQLMEHAIVHILRHRRQIERIKKNR